MSVFADLMEAVWPVFLDAIRNRRTVVYSELASQARPPIHPRHVARKILEPLSQACRRHGLPNLSALVVSKGTGVPGGGWVDPDNPSAPLARWTEEVFACWDHPWPSRLDPRLLAQEIQADSVNSA